MNYYSGNVDEFIKQKIDKLFVNDDLYDECVKLTKANNASDKLTQLKNSVAYCEIAYGFRKKQFEASKKFHNKNYKHYFEPMKDAMMQLLSARDWLMDYCEENRIKVEF